MGSFPKKYKYHDVFLSLGSNLSKRCQNLNLAISQLDLSSKICVLKRSKFYQSDPLYYLDQPLFINCIISISTDLNPFSLMERCMVIENRMGRIRVQKYGPRIIDIDIIFFNKKVVQNNWVQIPHPKYSERKFVLLPLAEIAPDFVCPISGLSVMELLEKCPDHSKVLPYIEAKVM